MKKKVHGIRFSLKYKMLLLSFLLILIPTLIIGIFSFYTTTNIIKEKVSTSNLETVNQVGSHIDFIMEDLENVSLFLIQSDIVRKFFQLKNTQDQYSTITAEQINLRNYLINIINTKELVHSIYFKGFNGVELGTSFVKKNVSNELEEKLIQLKGSYIWFNDQLTLYNNTSSNVITLTRIVKDINNLNNNLAILRINVYAEKIENIMLSGISGSGFFSLVNETNEMILSVDQGEMGKSIHDLNIDELNLTDKQGYFEQNINGKEYLVTYYNLEYPGWRIINIQAINDILIETKVIQRTITWLVIACFGMCMLFSLFFTYRFLKPIQQLSLHMKNLEKTDFSGRVYIESGDEIEVLAESFNSMSSRLKKLINKVYIMEIKRKDAELQALQAQINPHFLYNSLDLICWSSRASKDFETAGLTEALATLFRLSLNKGSDITTVRKEIEHVQSYIAIQRKRYEDKITFKLSVEEHLYDYFTLRMVLQPLVENAIYHGLEKKEEEGIIEVSVFQERQLLVFRVTDNGIGADLNALTSILNGNDNKEGIAIRNINERIKLHFGKEYGLNFSKNDQGGLTVIVYQPLKKEG